MDPIGKVPQPYLLPGRVTIWAIGSWPIITGEESMEFTKEEFKMIAHLKRQHAGWKSTRVIILISSLGLIAFGISLWNTSPPSLILFWGLASGCLSYCLGGWAGRPEVSLLLKLVEERQKQNSN